MVDITEISAIIAAIGVLVGVVLAVFELRNITRARQMDLIMNVHSTWLTTILQSWDTVRKTDFKNYSEFEEKCSKESMQVATFFDSLGLLLKRKFVDIDLVSELFIMERPWRKMKPFVEGVRERANDRRVYGHFEYLYNEWKKTEQTGVSHG